MAKISDYFIATLGSHTALQILKGAHDEGFKTICICKKGQEKLYKSYGVADEIMLLDDFTNFFEIEDKLIKKKKSSKLVLKDKSDHKVGLHFKILEQIPEVEK